MGASVGASGIVTDIGGRVGDFYAAYPPATGLTRDEVAALYIYTTESVLYRQLNAMLRDANRGPWSRSRPPPLRHPREGGGPEVAGVTEFTGFPPSRE